MSKYLGPRLHILKNLYLTTLQSIYTKKINNKNLYKKKSYLFFYLKKKSFLKFYYNLTLKQLINYKKLIINKYNYNYLELLFLLEQKIDIILFNFYITKTILESKHYILNNKIFINKFLIRKYNFIILIGDIIIIYINKKNFYNYYLKFNNILMPKIILKKLKLLILRHSYSFELPIK